MDNCSMCGHPWHGLTCNHKNSKLDENYRFSVTEKCKCPGPFGLPVDNEGPRNPSKKGTW